MEIIKAIANVSAEIGNIKKTENNSFYKSKYVPLDNILDIIKPIMSKNGLGLISYADTLDGKPCLRTILTHADGGKMELGAYPLNPAKDDPQGIGASITYARRYQIQAIFNFTGEDDDDGNTASGLTNKKTEAKKGLADLKNELLNKIKLDLGIDEINDKTKTDFAKALADKGIKSLKDATLEQVERALKC